MKYLKQSILAFSILFAGLIAKADEGMWLPFLLEKLNEKKMKSLGMKISAKDIYSINKGSLKDAIVHFNGSCTGEIISLKGLVLTNHHCGFGAIQNHSTLERNYIQNGFWAKNYKEELPNPKMYVTFIIRIDDVSKAVLAGTKDNMDESDRQTQIERNIAEIRKSVRKESHQESLVKPFFEGNQYFLFITETYKDIRLVGAPPSSIGNFGMDTDNWMWPRHTGDFSMFRIYAGKNNKPAEYSADNVPYVPKRSLSISLDGVKENDFTMVFGFPGLTTEYLHSEAVKLIMEVNDPAKIAIRGKALQVLDGFMRKDEKIKLMYADKYRNLENAYKKWKGEVLGLTTTNAVSKKIAYETEFEKRIANKKPTIAQPVTAIVEPLYATNPEGLIKELGGMYESLRPLGYARDYYTEITAKIELFTIASKLNSLITAYENDGEAGYTKRLVTVKDTLGGLYEEYSPEVDQKLFETLMEMYVKDQEEKNVSPMLLTLLGHDQGNYKNLATRIYEGTKLNGSAGTMALLNRPAAELILELKNMEVVKLYLDILKTYQEQVLSNLNEVQSKINQLQRTYMREQMKIFKGKTFYPDANRTMRVTYGKIKGYAPRDAVAFDYYTYLDGVMEKYKPGDYEFDVPEKLKTLYANKDYGVYGVKGRMPVCFIGTNHTTGGNSGSPALDAYGNLVGLNFDRVWEGTMSDINYDPSICRNIMVDIRYVLFIVDKFAGAGHLLSEMKLVHPKAKK